MPTNALPKKLTTKQIKCIELMVEGWKQGDIAHEIGIASETISRWKNQDLFIQEYKNAIDTKFKYLAGFAQKTIEDLAKDSKNDNVRLSAAKDILDRGGYKPVEEIEGNFGLQISIDYGDGE